MAHVITFAQQKGGAGKTMLLAQIAAALAARGRPVAAIDLDPQRSLTRWGELRAANGRGGVEVTESSDWRASTEIGRAARTAEVVLVDCPGSADKLLRSVIRESDLVLSPCQPSAVDAWATLAVVEMARKDNRPHAVALNRVPPRGGALDDTLALLAKARAEVLPARLGNRVAFSNSFMAGAGVAETEPRSKAAAELAELIAALKL